MWRRGEARSVVCACAGLSMCLWLSSFYLNRYYFVSYLLTYLLTYKGPSRSDGNGRGPSALCPAAHVTTLNSP